MDVDAAKARGLEYRLGEQQAIGHHDHQVGIQGGQLCLGLWGAQTGWLQHGQLMLLSQLLDRAGGQLVTASGWAIRLSVGCDYVEASFQQRPEVRGGKVRGSGEDDFQILQVEFP